MNISDKRCTPCQGGIPPLATAEARQKLAEVPGWELAEEDGILTLRRSFAFKNWAEAFAFVSRISETAEQEGHHPDVRFGWGYCTVSIHTHKIGGLHENDFILAAKASRLV